MVHWSTLPATLLLYILGTVAATRPETFKEELTLRPLRDGKVISRFSFSTLLEGGVPRNPEKIDAGNIPQHYTLFPLALGQVLQEYATTELHLSLNAGKWDYDRWGYPDEQEVGTGAQLWAWIGDGGSSSVDERWKGLRNALAGLFCASIGSLDEQRTTIPKLAFAPEGDLPAWTLPHQLRHATLPSETVCTENLTPFLKLLPCKGISGIATLLNPHRLFGADWHGMSVHVTWHAERGVEVRLAFQAVFDPVRLSFDKKRDWSLQSIFGRPIGKACPVASASRIVVELPTNEAYSIDPQPSTVQDGKAIYDTSNIESELNLALRWPLESEFVYPLDPASQPPSPLSVQRTMAGTSQSRGRLSVSIRNSLPSEIQAVYLETMPWHVQFYLHTLKISNGGSARDDLLSDIAYTPPVPHGRPALFESVLTLPPNSTTQLEMEVMKSFLRYTEHPPDAQRGWDLPPAVLVPLADVLRAPVNGSEPAGRRARIYTRVLLVDLATPDFSMPYNVIIMSCTLIALTFGMVFNLMTRRFVVVRLKTGPVAENAAEEKDKSI
ncbi:Gpi16 subunit, GPI transamidase component [Gloeophyllum trabeum ATCC 11539]|uniref:Gpi16 subunit, GPI transamidase component n=1 Tax=Gloeophyllum trabeum (strain ATCC 11539 / FP-39264 / Madison 617) TaxID=670483 RepID=S7RPS0_GLOTA|nr:Gpi16 subunit, GPI transamidase component [Gloeophyllum trabeum ATCC 11539]EPQ54884.1 Gpi16 subunit, GPI transamidase component [Gloeophyllum trabeum ATCC 11539]